MIKFIRNALILIAPFLFMVVINEFVQPKIHEKPYSAAGLTAQNSAEYMPDKCSWVCHNNTVYCKKYHAKYLKPYYGITDAFFFGVISLLASTGNYGAANIIFLVFLFPLTILYFLIKSINLQDEIRKLSK